MPARSKRSTLSRALGSFIYENWSDALTRQPLGAILEYPLFTDAEIVETEECAFGPSVLVNARRWGDYPDIRLPAILLRVQEFRPKRDPYITRATDAERYHGGVLADEIAALVSLQLGIRLKSGAISRMYAPEDDRFGMPLALDTHRNPVPPLPARQPVLPRAVGSHALQLPDWIERFPELAPDGSIALVRAARLYQEAMWVAETAPEISWLLFVSAVETAAGQWKRKDPPLERLRASAVGPALEQILEPAGGVALVKEVAEVLADMLGATNKFCSFLMTFLPPAPAERPRSGQHEWTHEALSKSLRTIYRHRSRALHGGAPFPAPMCEAPRAWEEHGVPNETLIGTAAATKGAEWLAEDVPMLLATFEYIARHALLGWWQSMLPPPVATQHEPASE